VQGVRKPDGTPVHELVTGEYSLTEQGTAVWLCNPDGVFGRVESPKWSITVEDDDTITVHPSILWTEEGGWHGYLERGIWRSA
jgi:hypothetical protein